MDIRELIVPGVNISNTFLRHGVHIAGRRGVFCSIALFQVKDFYVEVYYNKKTNEVARVKTFHGTDLLEPYLKQIDISGIFNY